MTSLSMNLFGCECMGPSALGCGGPNCAALKKAEEKMMTVEILPSSEKQILQKLDIIIELLKNRLD